MKKVCIISAFLTVFLFSCNDSTTSPQNTAYDGSYSGTVIDSSDSSTLGPWAFTITSGALSGTYTHNAASATYSLSGSVTADGSLSFTQEETKFGIARYTGTISASGAVSGTWNDDDSRSGTFSGNAD